VTFCGGKMANRALVVVRDVQVNITLVEQFNFFEIIVEARLAEHFSQPLLIGNHSGSFSA
jgi:hypothetical protein